MEKENKEKEREELALLDREVISEYLRKKIEQWWKNRPEVLKMVYYDDKEIENLDINQVYNEVSNWLLEIFTIKDIRFGTDENPDENSIYLNGKLVFSITKFKNKQGKDTLIIHNNSNFIQRKALELIGDKK